MKMKLIVACLVVILLFIASPIILLLWIDHGLNQNCPFRMVKIAKVLSEDTFVSSDGLEIHVQNIGTLIKSKAACTKFEEELSKKYDAIIENIHTSRSIISVKDIYFMVPLPDKSGIQGYGFLNLKGGFAEMWEAIGFSLNDLLILNGFVNKI